MRPLVHAIFWICLTTRIAYSCEAENRAFGQNIKALLINANDLQTRNLAGYLSDLFYDDLACRLEPLYAPKQPQPLTHEALKEHVASMLSQRNQSDALLLILTAMQNAEIE